MAAIARPSLSFAQRRKGETREFRLMFLVCFAVFLVAAIVGRLLPSRGRSDRPGRRRRSILEEARAAATTSIPFAFMG